MPPPCSLLPLVSQTTPVFSIAPFRFDVTPPLNHALLGGLVMPAIGYDDSLEAIGYVLLGPETPIVVCAVDWAGLMNDAHLAWRNALAEAAGTTPDRVAVHCVHQHNTPFACPEARALAGKHKDLPEIFDPVFFETCLARGRAAIKTALTRLQPVTHVAHGESIVHRVASNRRVARNAAGRVTTMRLSSCTDPKMRALPEGTIDPKLQTVAFFNGERKVVCCHYYATHPMSYYRDGRVSSDFCGLARKQRQAEEPGCTHLYFTGCAGNVAAGKYNQGSPADRVALTKRIHAGMRKSESKLRPRPLETVEWRTEEFRPPAAPTPTARTLAAQLRQVTLPEVDRLLAAFRLAWLRRAKRGVPIVLSCLRLNRISVLHLPGEIFVEYQLRAQSLGHGQPVATAAYGDDGLWYLPTKEEYPKGGYENTVAFCSRKTDGLLTAALRRLLAPRFTPKYKMDRAT